MIIKKVYDENTHTQKVWYDSSMIYYTEMVENEFENIGDLYVTFKNGTRYKYYDVSFEDYMLLIGGGTDASQGKTLNKIIKGKYEYEKVESPDMNLLAEELNKFEDSMDYKNVTYFISGHRDGNQNEFEFCYEPLINMALNSTSDAHFVIGDCEGIDIMAQNYLMDVIGIEPNRVTVYHVGDTPRNVNSKIINLVGGFKDDIEKDVAMTNASFEDIALVRDCTKLSGTAQNILRRYMLKSF